MNTDSHLARSVHRIPQFVWFHLSFVPSGGFQQGSIIKTHTETQTMFVSEKHKILCLFRGIFSDCRKFRRKFTELKYVGSVFENSIEKNIITEMFPFFNPFSCLYIFPSPANILSLFHHYLNNTIIVYHYRSTKLHGYPYRPT